MSAISSSTIKSVQAARKRAGIDDDTYREKLRIVYGVASTTQLTESQASQLLNELRGKKRQPSPRLSGPYAGKVIALWISGWNLGLIDDRSDAALLVFVERQTGMKSLSWVREPADAAKVIEGLKGWLAREAEVWWGDDRELRRVAPWTHSHGCRIMTAQWLRLSDYPGPWAAFDGSWQFISDMILPGFDAARASDADWITVMNFMGRELRRAMGRG